MVCFPHPPLFDDPIRSCPHQQSAVTQRSKASVSVIIQNKRTAHMTTGTVCAVTATTMCSAKKHPHTVSFISPRVMCRFKQKLQ